MARGARRVVVDRTPPATTSRCTRRAAAARAREALAHYEGVHAFFTRHLKLSPGRLPVARLIVFSNERRVRAVPAERICDGVLSVGAKRRRHRHAIARSRQHDDGRARVRAPDVSAIGRGVPAVAQRRARRLFLDRVDRPRAGDARHPADRPAAGAGWRGDAAPAPSSVRDRPLRVRVQLARACGPVLFTELGADSHAPE